jgi:8-hydroxy-5-deazaflavin:NADPH oxidoreductase
MTVAIVGGTGDQGFALALRLARAGESIVIGSRDAERGARAASKATERLGEGVDVTGTSNREAVARADVVFVTVPFAGHAEICRDIAEVVREGQIVCDCTSPLATAVGGRPWQVLRPWHGSVAEQAKELLPKTARIVSGFHTVAAEALEDLDHDLDGDVLLAGADDEAKATVGALAEKIPNLGWVDAGVLSAARLLEPLTAILVNLNRKHKVRTSGFRITGLPERRGG